MKNYSLIGSNATGTANKTGLTVIAAATVRPSVYDVMVGNAATPADQATNIALARFTAVGTTAASAPTPLPLDPNDAAAVATAGHAHSAEPTYTAGGKLLSFSMNQRATFRWVASPGSELRAPATANNGIGAYLVSATATMVLDFTLLFAE